MQEIVPNGTYLEIVGLGAGLGAGQRVCGRFGHFQLHHESAGGEEAERESSCGGESIGAEEQEDRSSGGGGEPEVSLRRADPQRRLNTKRLDPGRRERNRRQRKGRVIALHLLPLLSLYLPPSPYLSLSLVHSYPPSP